MSVLKGLDKIIDADPERFLKFISVGCDAIKFEDSCCNTCPLRSDNGVCIFAEKTVVTPDAWDFYVDDFPANDKERSKLFAQHYKIHITDILPLFKKKHSKTINPTPFKLPEIPDYVADYVDAYDKILMTVRGLIEPVYKEFEYQVCSDDTLAQMNQQLQTEIHKLVEDRRMRFHVDYSKIFKLFTLQFSRSETSKSEVTCHIAPKDPKQCYKAYKFITTTEDIEYYTEKGNTRQFIKAFEHGLFNSEE